MNSAPLRLGVHVADTKRGRTLGVAHFAANMIAALDRRDDIDLVIFGSGDTVSGWGVAETADPKSGTVDVDAVVQIHQFLERVVDAPTVAIVHDLHLFTIGWKYGAGALRLRGLLAANVSSEAVASEFPGTVNAIIERFPAARGTCHLLTSPTLLSDHPLTAEAREWASEDLADGSIPTMLYPAQLQSHKNHWNLVAAVALLRDRGTPVRVVCTGSSFEDHLTSSLVERAAQLGLSDLVRFAGYVSGENLRGLYAEVDGVVSPSLAEGGAYIAQEAIVHGRPVACSDLPAVRAHLARLEVDIPVFDPFDVEAIAAALSALRDSGDDIVAGYDRAIELEKKWTWAAIAEEVAELAAAIGFHSAARR